MLKSDTKTSPRGAEPRSAQRETSRNGSGRRPLGKKSMSAVLQIRLTEDMREAVAAMGGSTWARQSLISALKKAVRQGDARIPAECAAVLKSGRFA